MFMVFSETLEDPAQKVLEPVFFILEILYKKNLGTNLSNEMKLLAKC